MEKKSYVIMIPTDNNDYGYQLMLETNCFGEMSLRYANVPWIPNSEQRQYMYILDPDEQPKDGDWCYNGKIYTVFQYGKSELKVGMKIIASTDANLNLPYVPYRFITQYVREFNNGNIITQVLVEYQTEWNKETIMCMEGYGDSPEKFPYEPQPKINHKDNTIKISLIDDKDEYISALQQLVILLEDTYDHEERHEDITEVKARVEMLKNKLNEKNKSKTNTKRVSKG